MIHVHPKGFAFVSPDNIEIYPVDIFIPKHLKGNAVDGDRVEVAVYTEQRMDKGPEGSVLHVLKRAKDHLVGIVWTISPKDDYNLYIQSLGTSKSALVKKKKEENYQIGDRLLLHVKDWGEEKEPALCSVVEKLGNIDNPQTDVRAAALDFGIRQAFPQAVTKQVHNFSKEVNKKDLQDRRDLTSHECVTIDPDTAKDFDDALSLTQDQKGHFYLGVHIADVSHYVKEGSPLDQEAKKRSNSTYFPGQCIPMLPEALSNHLCSLKEQQLRLTLSVLVELDSEGNTLKYEIVRSYIKSRKRFTYKQAKQVLDKKAKSPHYDALKRMESLCLLLKKKRFGRGSVDLALPEIIVLLDQEGSPYDYETVEYDITHQLVEEFMLKANEIVAQDFVKREFPSIFRIHESPSPENLEDFYALARSLGFPLKDKPDVVAIQKLFELAKKSPHVEQLSVAYIRSMKLAIYSHENVGHYGLALENYSHFTSPIRRYSDLVIHRLLFEDQPPEGLEETARSCSEKERVSFKAEMHVVNLKKLRLQQLYQKTDPQKVHQGIVSKVKPFGIFFEVAPLQIEGFLHISDLEDDYYDFQSQSQSLVGKNTGKCFKIGEKIQISLKDIDLILMESKWKLLKRKKRKRR